MDLTWKLAGACRSLSTDMFFPASDSDAAVEPYHDAGVM